MSETKTVKTGHLASWFVAFLSFAENAPGPAQREWATRCAGEVLWSIGIPEAYGIQAVEPTGQVIDISPNPDPTTSRRLS